MCKESKSEKPDEDYSDGYRDTHALENGNDEKMDESDVGLPLGWEGVEITE